MPIVTDILFALILGAILSVVLVAFIGIRGPGPWAGLIIFFVVLFLGTWALGAWISPLGPSLWGSYWLAFLLVALIIALILAVAIGPKRAPKPGTVDTPEETTKKVDSAFGILFWILAILVAGMLIVRYIWRAT